MGAALQLRASSRVRRDPPSLKRLIDNISYEIIPFKSAEGAVVAEVPKTIPLTVTAAEAKGISATLSLAERLRGHGYQVAPHLPARLVRDHAHLGEIVARLGESFIDRVFVIGGDAPRPVGTFADAHSLLLALDRLEHPFTDLGIGGYPEGHTEIGDESLWLALKQKAPYASHIITQMCFDATTTAAWAGDVANSGIDVPIRVGMPGPVSRQKLVRISAGLGLGQSARFLQKQQSMLWRFLLPGGYHPARLVRRLGSAVERTSTHITGLHVYTFNELAKTEDWRRELVAALSSST